jgi:hypothetical protein
MICETSLAKTGIKSSIQNFQYAVTVEWDQKDHSFLKYQEDLLKKEIEELLKAGESPKVIMEELVSLIPDQRLQRDILEASSLYQKKEIEREELEAFLQMHLEDLQTRGPSWSPVVKFIVGLGIFYIVFNLFLFTLYYWDTDPNYGQVDNPPKT